MSLNITKYSDEFIMRMNKLKEQKPELNLMTYDEMNKKYYSSLPPRLKYKVVHRRNPTIVKTLSQMKDHVM